MEAVIVTKNDDLKRLIGEAFDSTLAHLREDLTPEPPEPPKPWLSNREAQEFLDLSKPTMQRYRDSGKLPYSKLGGNIYYRREDLLRVLEEHRVNGNGRSNH